MAASVSSRQKSRRIQQILVNGSAFYQEDAEQYSSAKLSVTGASESNSDQIDILHNNSLQDYCIAEVVDSDMNHSDTEPDSDSDEEIYVDCEEETETCYQVEEDDTFFDCEEHNINTCEMFLIVEYIIGEHETEVEVVPSSWYSSGQCWWPPSAFARSTLEKRYRSQWIVVKLHEPVMMLASLLLSAKTYAEAKANLPLAIAGESVAPSSTDVDGHKKGKREKQKTRRIDVLGPARSSQNASVSANYSDTHMTLPPVLNSLNINTFFSSQSSNEVSHTRPRIEYTENERSNSFDDRNGVTDEIISSPVIPRQQLAVARKSAPSPSAPISPRRRGTRRYLLNYRLIFHCLCEVI
ncbi:hypothetical protein DAPPUDRAFT_332832 [Daphnia pulex]|uniref:Uncharacterized protein n=1 Tax=Daphnia pulex TaxID=6669 RepID=E9HR28_DAPPU|nr:hypothetical protein DAPPUDRAFT_332832 [Daphnia pulex]|eukprot:EFX65796.1 hypothetical protein DAPPUDRAFT_332832 [Daphnia pulex]